MDPPSRIEVEGGVRMTLSWSDGTATIDARALREACMCAECRSEPGALRKAEVLAGPDAITIAGAELRGAYAVNIMFGPDGHSAGIFTWELLRSLA